MKRIVSLLLALSMIIAASFALSSCELISGIMPENQEGETPDNIKDGGNTEDEGNTDNGNKDENKDENVDTTPEVRTTITEAEWEDVINLLQNMRNYTCSINRTTRKCDISTGELLSDSSTIVMEYKFTEYAELLCSSFDGVEKTFDLFALINDVWYHINDTNLDSAYHYPGNEENNDSLNDNSNEIYDGYIGKSLNNHSHMPQYNMSSLLSYEELVYDEEKGAYILGESIFAYFENGKVTKFEFLLKTSYDDYIEYVEMVVSYTDIGTTVIEIPEFTISE